MVVSYLPFRKVYARTREIDLPPLSNGRQHYAELRFNPDHGIPDEFCVGYRVWHGSRFVEIVRYDSEHGRFHRHAAGYPIPGQIEAWFDVPMNLRGSFAVYDIMRNCESWQTVLPMLDLTEEPEI